MMDWLMVSDRGARRWAATKDEARLLAEREQASWRNNSTPAPRCRVVYQPTGEAVETLPADPYEFWFQAQTGRVETTRPEALWNYAWFRIPGCYHRYVSDHVAEATPAPGGLVYADDFVGFWNRFPIEEVPMK